MKNELQSHLIENEQEYAAAFARYQQIKYAEEGNEDHKEKLSLVRSIETYENSLWDLPDVNPIDMIKIRKNDFGYKAV